MVESRRNTEAITLLRKIVRALQRMEAEDQALAKGHGLSMPEFDVVATLGNTAGLRMCDLAGRSLKTAPNVTRIAKKLEERGLLTRERSSESDREVIAKLTDAGEALFAAAYPEIADNRRADVDQRLTKTEQRALIDLLDKLVDEPFKG